MPRSLTTHIDSPKAVGGRLRSARERAALSQRQLAFPGCTAAYISRIEAGARVPSLQMINQLAIRLDVSGQWLATGIEVAVIEIELVEAEVALRLGEVALVDGTSRVGQTGLTFYNTLFDENATCHIAYGAGIVHAVEGTEGLGPEELRDRGVRRERVGERGEHEVQRQRGEGELEPAVAAALLRPEPGERHRPPLLRCGGMVA